MTASNSSANQSGFRSHRLRSLTAALCDDSNSPADHAELEGILQSSESVRSQFLGDVCVHAGLEWDFAARGKLASLIQSCSNGKSEGVQLCSAALMSKSSKPTARPVARQVFIWATAASLLAAAMLVQTFVRQSPNGSADSADLAERNAAPSNRTAAQPVIAKISPTSDDCRWIFEKSVAEKSNDDDRSKICSGETLRVTSGTLQLKFDHGTAATLKAPALLEIVSPMRGRLIRGRVTVAVAEGAQGFTIDTPRTTVVDFGTIFGVEVDDIGRTDVVVFSGIVDVTYTSDVLHSANTETGKQRLYMGEAMRVDDRGTLSRIVSLSSNRFSAGNVDATAPARRSVISSVRDNIQRANAWNFYEIVPGGMREDAKAFVDRLHHEWNGVDAKGMPNYLVGADYVKTFNDDKNVGYKEIFVKLNQPATIYVLWCKRIPAPSWLRDEFEDTGDVIGVDEGNHTFADGTMHRRPGPGIGPGVSIDSIHSVWRRKEVARGTVRLGPTEAPGWDFNVYGIVAVPFNER
jgi:hypothetical protein